MTFGFPVDSVFRAGWRPLLGLCSGFVLALTGNAAVAPLAIDRQAAGAPATVGFQKDILPMFQANCLPCHNQTRAKAGLNLETPASLLRGGDTGPGAVPGKPAESLVLKSAAHQVEDLVMPPAGNKSNARDLTPAELGLLWRWIEQGAKADQAVVVEPAWKPISPDWKSSFAVALDSEGATVAVARANRVSVLEVATGRTVGRLEDPSLDGATQRDVVGALAFSPDDQWLATAGFREVRLWQRRPVTVEPVVSIPSKSAWVSAAFSPAGDVVASVTASGGLEIRSIPAGRLLGAWELKGASASGPSRATGLSWSPDAHWLAATQGRAGWVVSMTGPKPSLAPMPALPSEPDGMVWISGDEHWCITYGPTHPAQRLKRGGDGSRGGSWVLEQASAIPAASRALAADPSVGGSLWGTDGQGGLRRWGAAAAALQGFGSPVRSLLWDRSGSNGVVVLADGSARWLSQDLSNTNGHRTHGPRMAGDPRLSAEIVREEWELARGRLESTLATNRIQEARTAVTNAQSALSKAREKRDQTAKALAERKKEWDDQEALIAAATRDRDAAAAELAKAQAEVKSAGEAVQQASAAAKASPEAALKALDDLVAKSERLGRGKAVLERAEAEVPARRKKAEEQLAAAQKKSGEFKGPLDKARVLAEGAAQDVALSEKALTAATDSVSMAESEERQARERIVRTETRLQSARVARDRAASEPFRAAALSASGGALLTAGGGGLWTRWHPGTGRAVETFAVGRGEPLALSASGDDEFLAAFPDGVSRIRTARAWFLRQRIAGTSNAPAFTDRVNALAFSPDGTLLATGGGEPSRSGELKLWKLPEVSLALDLGALHSDAVTAVAFSPRGDRLASAGTDRFARITGLQTNAARFNLEGHTHHVIGVAWSPDGGVLATAGAEGTVKLWNPRTGERRKNVDGFGKEVTGLQAAGASLRFVALSGAGGGRVFKADGEKLRDLATVPDYLQALAVSRDGRWIVGGDDRGNVRVWDAENGQLRQSWEP
ncbi:MAG: Chromosome partition protein Smc [Verrucomicrobiota bacterium]